MLHPKHTYSRVFNHFRMVSGFNVLGVVKMQGKSNIIIVHGIFLLKCLSDVPKKSNELQGLVYFLCREEVVVYGPNKKI